MIVATSLVQAARASWSLCHHKPMNAEWLTFTDFKDGRAIAIRRPITGHWRGIDLRVESDRGRVWCFDDGTPAVVEMKLDQETGLPVADFDYAGLYASDLLHSPTLGPGMMEGVVWSRMAADQPFN